MSSDNNEKIEWKDDKNGSDKVAHNLMLLFWYDLMWCDSHTYKYASIHLFCLSSSIFLLATNTMSTIPNVVELYKSSTHRKWNPYCFVEPANEWMCVRPSLFKVFLLLRLLSAACDGVCSLAYFPIGIAAAVVVDLLSCVCFYRISSAVGSSCRVVDFSLVILEVVLLRWTRINVFFERATHTHIYIIAHNIR